MNHSICNTIYNKVSSGTFLYWYAVVALLLPNIALCFTERLSFWAGAANVLLPLALYMWFFSVARCPGKMVWWAFLFVFFAAFQLVLLYLFGTASRIFIAPASSRLSPRNQRGDEELAGAA